MKTLESPFERDIPGKPNLPYFDQSVAYGEEKELIPSLHPTRRNFYFSWFLSVFQMYILVFFLVFVQTEGHSFRFGPIRQRPARYYCFWYLVQVASYTAHRPFAFRATTLSSWVVRHACIATIETTTCWHVFLSIVSRIFMVSASGSLHGCNACLNKFYLKNTSDSKRPPSFSLTHSSTHPHMHMPHAYTHYILFCILHLSLRKLVGLWVLPVTVLDWSKNRRIFAGVCYRACVCVLFQLCLLFCQLCLVLSTLFVLSFVIILVSSRCFTLLYCIVLPWFGLGSRLGSGSGSGSGSDQGWGLRVTVLGYLFCFIFFILLCCLPLFCFILFCLVLPCLVFFFLFVSLCFALILSCLTSPCLVLFFLLLSCFFKCHRCLIISLHVFSLSSIVFVNSVVSLASVPMPIRLPRLCSCFVCMQRDRQDKAT